MISKRMVLIGGSQSLACPTFLFPLTCTPAHWLVAVGSAWRTGTQTIAFPALILWSGCATSLSIGSISLALTRSSPPARCMREMGAICQMSRSPKAGHNKAGPSDFRNQRCESDTGKFGKCGRSLSPQKNKGLWRCPKTRKMQTRKLGKY